MHQRSIDYHRRPIRLLNSVLRCTRALGVARMDLRADELLARARKDTGLADFGDERFLEPMGVLIDALEQEADLNPVGRFMARANILRILKHRLLVQDLLGRHPEILERELPDPVVVVGLARSGTTRLHRLLAADQRFLHLASWESVYPVPWPESFAARHKGQPDPRIKALDQALKAVLYMNPGVAAVHPLGTHEVEEEVGLIQHGFSSQLFEIMANVPSFAAWLMRHDQTAAYEYMVVLLKVIAWFRDDPADMPWVLKTPQHMQDLDALLNVFPGARLVCCHRDPVPAVGSACSMAWNALVRDSDSLRAAQVGPVWLNKTEQMLHKTLKLRDERVPQEQQYDVLYADIGADWHTAMAGIYDFLGMEFSDQAGRGMQAWLDQNRQHKHGSHDYRLEDFGLDSQVVEARLGFYRRRFDIPLESRGVKPA